MLSEREQQQRVFSQRTRESKSLGKKVRFVSRFFCQRSVSLLLARGGRTVDKGASG